MILTARDVIDALKSATPEEAAEIARLLWYPVATPDYRPSPHWVCPPPELPYPITYTTAGITTPPE